MNTFDLNFICRIWNKRVSMLIELTRNWRNIRITYLLYAMLSSEKKNTCGLWTIQREKEVKLWMNYRGINSKCFSYSAINVYNRFANYILDFNSTVFNFTLFHLVYFYIYLSWTINETFFDILSTYSFYSIFILFIIYSLFIDIFLTLLIKIFLYIKKSFFDDECLKFFSNE